MLTFNVRLVTATLSLKTLRRLKISTGARASYCPLSTARRSALTSGSSCAGARFGLTMGVHRTSALTQRSELASRLDTQCNVSPVAVRILEKANGVPLQPEWISYWSAQGSVLAKCALAKCIAMRIRVRRKVGVWACQTRAARLHQDKSPSGMPRICG